jgi:hypothetical protein
LKIIIFKNQWFGVFSKKRVLEVKKLESAEDSALSAF